jgi:hypothetical protein
MEVNKKQDAIAGAVYPLEKDKMPGKSMMAVFLRY